jgi:hypothetical protein
MLNYKYSKWIISERLISGVNKQKIHLFMSVDILVIFVAAEKYFKILLIETVLLFLAVNLYKNGGAFSLSILKEVVINLFLAVD